MPENPNSPVFPSDVNLNEDVPFDENDVEIMEEDEGASAADSGIGTINIESENQGASVVDSGEEENTESEGQGSSYSGEEENTESEDVGDTPERDDAQIVFTLHERGVLCCDFHPKSNSMVATGGMDDNAFIWDSSNGNNFFTCKGHEDSVEFISFSHDGSYLATADLNGCINVWRTRDFTLIETFELYDEFSWMIWHGGTNVLVTSSLIGMIHMFKIPSGERKLVMVSFGQNCIAGKILPDGKSLVCGYKDGNVKIVDLRQGAVLKDVKPFDEIGAITCIDVHRSNNLIICGCESGVVMLINPYSGKVASVLQGSQNQDGSNYIEAVSFCKDQSYPFAASGSLDGSLIVWDIVRQTLRHKFNFPLCVNHLSWHPNSPVLFTCHVEGVARACDAKAGVIIREYLGHRKSCLNMCLSSDGSLLMTVSEDKTARIFSVGDIVN